MEILFGIVVLVLLVWGLANRKKAKKEWIQEERYEESGSWIDKRSGERGTYGSLDEEMEANRKYISQQGKVNELSRAIQAYLGEHQPGYSRDVQAHYEAIKSEIQTLFRQIEALKKGQEIPLRENETLEGAIISPLKKQILDFAYQEFPELLNLEIAQIKRLDAYCVQMCARILR
ncbi:MAG TPA: hypothetical protein VK168_08200 [Saprospiraceae bacterium]|nr:hypothetical protein [Saprospiraceae bacterium]